MPKPVAGVVGLVRTRKQSAAAKENAIRSIQAGEFQAKGAAGTARVPVERTEDQNRTAARDEAQT